MTTFVHIADLHIGMSFKKASFGKGLADERRREIKETLYKVLFYCEENRIDLLLIAGDLFEEAYVSISDLRDLNHRFSNLSQTRVLISAGNHDPLLKEHTSYNMIQWCDQVYLFGTTMERLYIEELSTEIHSFSWDKKHLEPLNVNALPHRLADRYHILMLHGDAYNQGDYLTIKPSDLASMGYDYIALGHIHKPDFIHPWMAYSGSLEPLDFSETGDHGFIQGHISNEGLVAEFVPFAKRIFHSIEVPITGEMSYEAIKDRLMEVVNKGKEQDLYRIVLTGFIGSEVTIDMDELKQMAMEKVHYLEIKDKLEVDLDIEGLKRDYEGSLIGAYINHIESLEEATTVKKDALYEGLRILLKGQVTS